jgi:hypothetical protein
MHPDVAWKIAQAQTDEQHQRMKQRRLRQQLEPRNLQQRMAFRCGRVLLRCSRWLLRYSQHTTQAHLRGAKHVPGDS